MDQTQRSALKIKIEQKIKRMKVQILDLEEATKPIPPENSIGRISRMDAINNRSVNESALRQAKAKMEGLKTALDRIEDVDFGLCTRCKQEIPIGRLLLVPESSLCISCAR